MTGFDWVDGSPPVGENVTLALTFALPFSFSFFFALPVAFNFSFTVPAAVATALEAFSPLPERLTVPAPGTSMESVAVPFFWFRLSAPILNWLEGLVGLEGAIRTGSGPMSRKAWSGSEADSGKQVVLAVQVFPQPLTGVKKNSPLGFCQAAELPRYGGAV